MIDQSQADIVLKSGAAEQRAHDALAVDMRAVEKETGYWPRGATVVRVVVIVFVALVLIGWALSAFNH